LRKSIPYNIIGAVYLLVTIIAIIVWVSTREPKVYEDGFVRVHVYYPLSPALPYLALIACVLGFLCFIFGYNEGLKEGYGTP
jgi:formate hydrogenlyase subunit 3/multisubunit Na+/H+ antiporter MnhD subunit